MQLEAPAAAGPASLDEVLAALESGNIPTMLLVLATLTGDDAWLREPYTGIPLIGPGDHDTGGLSDELQREVRAALGRLLVALRADTCTPAPPPSPERVAEMLSRSLGCEIPREGGALLAEELGVHDRWVDVPSGADLDVLVVGSGFSGIAAAVALQRAGVPYSVVEKNSSLGGTWFENSYPGCGVDTPSHLYSFSWARNAYWSGFFSQGPEVRRYLARIAEEQGVTEHIRFGREVESATWDEASQRWLVRVRRADGAVETLTPRIFISAVGLLNRPAYPQIPGLDTFAGACMHTARWQPDVDLAGRRVAVIGTGASSMQLVTTIAGVAEHVDAYQRTPQWAIPHPNIGRRVAPEVQLLLEAVPYYGAWYRVRQVWNSGDRLFDAVQVDPDWPHQDRSISKVNESHRKFLTRYILEQLGDRTDLVDKCVPTYPPYGKRPLLDHGWYRTMTRDDVSLITDDIARVTPTGVVTGDGEEHRTDVIVLATGFQALNMLAPMNLYGRSGTALRDVWGSDDARAYLGLTVPDFPNLFCLWGPNSNVGHGGSHALSVELQVRWIMEMLASMAGSGLTSVEPRREVFDAYNERLDEALARTVWTHPGMNNYYRNSKGRVVYNLPYTNTDYWHMIRKPDLADFVVRAGAANGHQQP